jgi:hypothetical protein
MMRQLAWLAALAVIGLAAGCSTALERVQPWERGELAGDLMRPDLNGLQAKDWNHIAFSKEASPPGGGSGGGGCGCN